MTGHFTGAAGDLDVMIMEVWGEKLNDFYRDALQITPFFTDRSDELVEGGDTLHTPNLTEMTAATKTNGAQVTLASPTETQVNLVVDQWKEVSFLIEDREAAQVKRSYNLQQRYMKNAAYTAASQLETSVATLFQSFSTSKGTTTVALTRAVVLAAISALRQAKNNLKEAAFFLAPKTVWEDLMAIDAFALSLNTANATNPITKGRMPGLYNIPVFDSVFITKINANADFAGALCTPDAIHYAQQLNGNGELGVRLQAQYKLEYLGTLVVCDILYGTIENRDAAGVRIVSAV